MQIPGCLTRPAESPILILGCKNMHFKEDFQVILLHAKMCELLHEVEVRNMSPAVAVFKH